MINELYQLTKSLEEADITAEHTHPNYKLIPKVTKKAPCVQIILENGQLYKIRSITADQAVEIRKYGTNQGTYPAMNLAPLYRLTDEVEKKEISDLIEGKTTDFNMERLHNLCVENNWGKKFKNKYRISMVDIPRELFSKEEFACLPLQRLVEETDNFVDADNLHRALEDVVFKRLEEKTDIRFALQILFHMGKQEKERENDYGTLSVVMDSKELINEGISTATEKFTNVLNQKLIEADDVEKMECAKMGVDAFGKEFVPLKKPMPTVKLAAGFEVSLRTMFRGQPCQSRYGRIENETYPISKEMRFKLQAALAWLSNAEHKEITWTSTDKDEALFAYPETLRKNTYSLVSFCRRFNKGKDENEKIRNRRRFEAAAKAFIEEIEKTKTPGTDPMTERIQYFILRKLDKARTKVVYTYNTSPREIEQCSEKWTLGCKNIPEFSSGAPATLFPLEISDVLNQIWRQDGKQSTDKFKPFPRYHGIQLLFVGKKEVIRRDLFVLTSNVINLGPYLGRTGIYRRPYDKSEIILLQQTQKMLVLMGLFLYQLGIRKEKYMQEFPYLFGQLLKVSDELHEMYCRVMRNNDVPNVLAGSGLYIMGAEQPYKTLGVLGQRMNPYIAWARSYTSKGIEITGEESWRARWYLSLYEKIAVQLHEAWSGQVRFNEEEKAQYFIGYLAKFPRNEKTENIQYANEESM